MNAKTERLTPMVRVPNDDLPTRLRGMAGYAENHLNQWNADQWAKDLREAAAIVEKEAAEVARIQIDREANEPTAADEARCDNRLRGYY